jgi:pimeloyl-[acyl-carrier protein] methyl ester esterase
MTTKLHIATIGYGEPLVLLHGWGWHSGIWAPLLPQLTQHFQLFLIDLPGCGKSPLLSDYSIDEIIKNIFFSVPEHATWMGWSLGGMLAWWAAIHFPHKISRLITIASSPKFVSSENWPGVSRETLEKFQHSLTENYHQTLQDFLDLQLRGSPRNSELLTELNKQLLISQQTPLAAVLGGLHLLHTLDLRNSLNKLQCSSLHLFGSHDTLVPKEITQRIQPLLPQGKCEVIQRAGHLLFLTHTEEFLQKIISD